MPTFSPRSHPTTNDEALEILRENPAVLATTLRDARDVFAALTAGHPNPGALESAHKQFWRDIAGKPIAEQLIAAKDHLATLGAALTERERNALAAAAEIRQREANVRRIEAERARQQAYAAQVTRGLQAAVANLQTRLGGLGQGLGSVASPADLQRWWQNFDAVIEAAKGSVAAELARHGADVTQKAA